MSNKAVGCELSPDYFLSILFFISLHRSSLQLCSHFTATTYFLLSLFSSNFSSRLSLLRGYVFKYKRSFFFYLTLLLQTPVILKDFILETRYKRKSKTSNVSNKMDADVQSLFCVVFNWMSFSIHCNKSPKHLPSQVTIPRTFLQRNEDLLKRSAYWERSSRIYNVCRLNLLYYKWSQTIKFNFVNGRKGLLYWVSFRLILCLVPKNCLSNLTKDYTFNLGFKATLQIARLPGNWLRNKRPNPD